MFRDRLEAVLGSISVQLEAWLAHALHSIGGLQLCVPATKEGLARVIRGEFSALGIVSLHLSSNKLKDGLSLATRTEAISARLKTPTAVGSSPCPWSFQ